MMNLHCPSPRSRGAKGEAPSCYNLPVRKWWVWPLLVFVFSPLTLTAAESAKDVVAASRVAPDIRAIFTREYEIEVVVQPHDGDAWTRLAKRVTADAARWEEIAQLNGADDNLRAGRD